MSDGILSDEMEEYFWKRKHYIDAYEAGANEKACEMILNMSNNNEPLDKICKYTNLDIKTVQDVIENYQNEKENG